MEFVYLTFVVHFRRHKANFRIETLVTKQFQVRRCPDNVFAETPPYLLGIKNIINSFKKHIEPLSNFGECPQHGKRSLTSLKIRCPGIYIPAKIRAVTLGSNFTARISCQVSFCQRKISGLELIFSVVDLDFKAVDQLIGVKPYLSNLYHDFWHSVIHKNIQL